MPPDAFPSIPLFAVKDDETHEMEVVFNSGKVYRYIDVDKRDYQGLLDADSKGRYMRANIIGVYADYKISRRRRR